MWHYAQPSPLEKGLMVIGFLVFLLAALAATIFIRSPRLRLDDDGITVFDIWRKRVLWKNVAQCEIQTIFNYLGQGPTRIFVFKAATGKSLLSLTPLWSSGISNGLSREEQAEIEAEVRRRLGDVSGKEAEPKQ